MSTPEFEIHRAIVHSSNVTTGAAEVRIPSLLGAGQTVNIPTTGLTLSAGEWNVPSAGSSAFVAVSADRTQFLWLTGVTVPTDSDIDFTDNVTIGGDLTVDGDIDATHINSEFDGPVVISIKNTSGSTIAKGSPVYATGSVGQSGAVEVSPSRADTSGTMPALGLTQVELVHNGEGHAVILGVIDQADTSAYTINDSLYVAPTGGLTNTRPTGGNDLIQKIGRVVRVNQSTGEILVLGAGRTNDVPNVVVAGGLTIDTDTLHVDSTNNSVGIGTTSPSAPLEISTSVNTEALRLSANFTTGGQETYITAVDTGDSSILAAIGLGSTGGANDNDGAITFRTTTASSTSVPATQVIITKDGNVGIGTTSPSALLEVANSTEAVVHINDTGGNSSSINSKLWFQSGGTDRGMVGYDDTFSGVLSLYNHSGNIRIETNLNDDIEFYTHYSQRMVIDGNGYVGINKANPGSRLHVDGNVRVDGNLNAYNVSDERLKKNIEQYSGGLSLVRQLNPVTYVWDCDEIDDSGDTKIGLIAQEVEAVRPEWVGTMDERVFVRNSDGQEITDMSAISLVGNDTQTIMISAIKELADRLDEVSARLATLEGS
jgi:hypothetical protein